MPHTKQLQIFPSIAHNITGLTFTTSVFSDCGLLFKN